MIPQFFKEGCCAFFGGTTSTFDESFWNIRQDILVSELFKAFNNDWKLYFPEIYVPPTMTWIEYASQCNSMIDFTPTSNYLNVDETKPQLSQTHSSALPNIAIIGEIGHGKSTVAEYLCKTYSYTEYAFAFPLKEGIRILFSLSQEQLYGNKKHEVDSRWNVSPRYLLQCIGTDLFRNNISRYIPAFTGYKNIWISNFLFWFRDHATSPVVISDCRFKNEVDLLSILKFQICKIHRPNIQSNHHTTHHTVFTNHESEDLSKQPTQNEIIQISNNGSTDELYKKIDKIIALLFPGSH